ncbi:hypothetical protein [Echinicola vietnamensis]|uniref:Lipocalin-like domain-containing protein n=1 Tax=Echinicola vietnamensis (strain DSM 17526 / LMG 23754 / KMM 6221) TaxID=926556 RepID=L0FZY5_ECHVK|nr:hypothetical protein [Echinicola vietnamensis]AGA78867.1 hypothetical protein Echvi_2625 [Echinicola vietnamensis DSM 17526]
MKIKIMYVGVFVLLFGVVVTLVANDVSPERKLIGKWEEVMWKYEKLDSSEGNVFDSFHINDQLKQEISRELVIHKAETWEIKPEGELLLHKKNGASEHLHWRLKGRGHVLKLFGHGDSLEHYQIQKLTDDTMEIHFNSDLQARGIIKMTFKKAKS